MCPSHFFLLMQTISIHAPARGATPLLRDIPQDRTGFQSTLPRGERQKQCNVDVISISISIHAPARGATVPIIPYDTVHKNFNPRSREGSDVTGWRVRPHSLQFQSTLPRGERPQFIKHRLRQVCISIHAPARGATGDLFLWMAAMQDFNPRSREGSDSGSVLAPPLYQDFNPRSREGSDGTDPGPLL